MTKNIYTAITGIGIGILMGLSKSPILAQILVPILTVMVSLISILSGQTTPTKSEEASTILGLKNINILPVMSLVIGLVFGAYFGLLARNYDITNPSTWAKRTKSDNEIDSLTFDIKLLSLRQSKLILEKQNNYLLNQEIKPNSDGLTYSDLTNLLKSFEEQNKKIEKFALNTDDKSKDLEEKSILHGVKGASAESVCKIKKFCRLDGVDLIFACQYIDNAEIREIINSSTINIDSLKSKMHRICKCNQ
ncbi:MAG: hypothetical protein KIS77_11235 [Saprospiraceae bacterium]|nr:hypothetical protein [Saprospiraceae bacterium]